MKEENVFFEESADLKKMSFLKKLPSLRWYIRFEENAFFEESADLKKMPFSPYFRCSENPLRRLAHNSPYDIQAFLDHNAA